MYVREVVVKSMWCLKKVFLCLLMYIILLTLLVSEEVFVSPAPPPLTPLTPSRGSKEETV